jgi:hypothetical protein
MAAVRDQGHAAVEFAMAVVVLLLPAALVVTAFGPWSERRVFAESAAAEAARVAVVELDGGAGMAVVAQSASNHGLGADLVRVGWCGGAPGPLDSPGGSCSMIRGSSVEVRVDVWTPLIRTPWGPVGGLWITASHIEPVDLYRSLG